MLNHVNVLQSNVVQPWTKCYTLIWSNPKSYVVLLCVSTIYQMIQSNVASPIIHRLSRLKYIYIIEDLCYPIIYNGFFRTEVEFYLVDHTNSNLVVLTYLENILQ